MIMLVIFLFCGCKTIIEGDFCYIYEPVKNYGYIKDSDKILYDAIKLNNVVYTRLCLNGDKTITENKNN